MTIELFKYISAPNDDDFARVRNFKRANCNALIAHIESSSIDYVAKFNEGFNRHIPTFRPFTAHHGTSWHAPELSTLKKYKNELHTKYARNQTAVNYADLCAARSEYQYNVYLIEIKGNLNANPKRFSSYVNLRRKTLGKTSVFPCAMTLNKKCANGESEIAKLFADLSSTSFQRNSTTQMPKYMLALLH